MNEELIIRYLNHQATPQEEAELARHTTTDTAYAASLFEAERIWRLKDELRFADRRRMTAAYRRLWARIHPGRSQRRMWAGWRRTAAVAVLLLSLATNLYFLSRSGGRDATIDDNKVEVPAGQRVSLTLSDGTRVWLNACSSLSYPSRFADAGHRRVRLQGEGYFEVAHDERVPFVVESGKLDVQVLGTRFNLKAYPDEPAIVTLLEGGVEVKTTKGHQHVRLQPGEEVACLQAGNLAPVRPVEAAVTCRWTTGEAAYVNRPLSEIVHDLERRFAVRIRLSDDLPANEPFTCRFGAESTLPQVLSLLKATRTLDFHIRGDSVELYAARPVD